MKIALAVSLILLVFSIGAFAQAAGVAGISGVVRDPSGAVVPGAKVVIASENQGTIRTLNTNDAGLFTAPALTPGPGYMVTVTAEGFGGFEAKSLALAVGQEINLNISLKVATSTTAIEVTTTAPLVEDTKTDVSQVIGTTQITDLPINGRRVDSFVLLTPGVTSDGYYGLLTFRGVAAGNSFLIDGNDTTEQFYNENAGRTRIAAQISQDAVQEFQVVSTNFGAEYGKAMGGVVNTVTRSGGNQLHGTAYEFFRNQDFNARARYATTVPDETRHQFGASIGGPIVKDKLFYFFNGDFTRRDFPLVSSVIRAGVIDTNAQAWIGCGAPATPAQCSAINALLPRFFGTLPRTVTQDLGFGRIDYHVNDRNTLSASLNYMRFISPNGIQTGASVTTGGAITSNGDDTVRVRNGKLSWTTVPTSSFVNEFRVGWSTDRQADTFNNASMGQGLGLLGVSVAGQAIGPAAYLPRVEPNEQRFQFADNASWTKGTHIFKLGADIANTADYTYYISGQYGSYSYSTVTAFAQDYSGNTTGTKYWNSFSQTFGNPVVDATIQDYGFYVEDQWRATSKLTFNYGARYEYAQLPQPKTFNPIYTQTGHINSANNNVMPRVGLAYRLNDKTVLRAGYGMFYARFAGGTIDNLFTNNGVLQTSISLSSTQAPQFAAGPNFPNALAAIPTAANLGTSTIQFAAPNLKTPYSEQGTFALERQLSHDIGITASYIWSRGVQLYGVRDLNLPTTTVPYTYTIGDATGAPVRYYTTNVLTGARPDSRFGAIYQDENGVNSFYNALAVQIRKQMSHGLQADVSYTWSHEIDDGQSYGGSSNNLFLSGAGYWLNNGNFKADKASGSEDQRHRFVANFVWAPTFSHRSGAFFKYVVNNWQLATITTLQSGRQAGSETIRMTDSASTFPVKGVFSTGNLGGNGLSSRIPWLGANNLYTPPSYRADARLSKIIPFGETKRNLALNFEVFNVSNTIADTSISAQAYTEAKGILTFTPTAFGQGTGEAGFPDGTQARRMQVSARFTF
ncbi:MAG: TonB-dependent receptor [Acidobacteriia bacterium]|nr:TonB-dependent receptor [Terriglobia bacterium]